jgi:SAM-dependent methyltransferase
MTPGHLGEVGQWPAVARLWRHLGPPLRPSLEDVTAYGLALRDWSEAYPGRFSRGLILGVTPELHHLRWPQGVLPRAIDRTPEMIEHVWPGEKSAVFHSDWLQFDWPERSFDIVLCDGGLHLLDYPAGQGNLRRALARAIPRAGLFVVRLFALPAEPESPDAVLAALLSGSIPNLNCLKLRLGMALQQSPSAGVALAHVWRTLRAAAGDWPALAARLQWPLEQLAAIDAYRDSAARYYFLTAEQAISLICGTDGAFELHRTSTPTYALGGQCPTLTFRRASID